MNLAVVQVLEDPANQSVFDKYVIGNSLPANCFSLLLNLGIQATNTRQQMEAHTDTWKYHEEVVPKYKQFFMLLSILL